MSGGQPRPFFAHSQNNLLSDAVSCDPYSVQEKTKYRRSPNTSVLAEINGMRRPKTARGSFSLHPVYYYYPHHRGIGSRKSPPLGISPSFSFIICISRRQFKNFSSSTPRQHRARWNSNSYS